MARDEQFHLLKDAATAMKAAFKKAEAEFNQHKKAKEKEAQAAKKAKEKEMQAAKKAKELVAKEKKKNANVKRA